MSKSFKAGIQSPVARIARLLNKGRYSRRRPAAGPPVHLGAVLRYLAAEVLEVAGNAAARGDRKSRIIPKHVLLAVRYDEDLWELLDWITVTDCGLEPGLLMKKAAADRTVLSTS